MRKEWRIEDRADQPPFRPIKLPSALLLFYPILFRCLFHPDRPLKVMSSVRRTFPRRPTFRDRCDRGSIRTELRLRVTSLLRATGWPIRQVFALPSASAILHVCPGADSYSSEFRLTLRLSGISGRFFDTTQCVSAILFHGSFLRISYTSRKGLSRSNAWIVTIASMSGAFGRHNRVKRITRINLRKYIGRSYNFRGVYNCESRIMRDFVSM